MVRLTTFVKIKAIKYLNQRGYSIKRACKTFNIFRSTYYYQLNQEKTEETSIGSLYSGTPAFDKEDNKLFEQEVIDLVKEYTSEHPYYGYRIITNYIKSKERIIVNHKWIYRIMQELNLLQKQISLKSEEYKQSQEHEIDVQTKCGEWIWFSDIWIIQEVGFTCLI